MTPMQRDSTKFRITVNLEQLSDADLLRVWAFVRELQDEADVKRFSLGGK